jgi:hypothetical protein
MESSSTDDRVTLAREVGTTEDEDAVHTDHGESQDERKDMVARVEPGASPKAAASLVAVTSVAAASDTSARRRTASPNPNQGPLRHLWFTALLAPRSAHVLRFDLLLVFLLVLHYLASPSSSSS